MDLPIRKSPRIPGYDYSSANYYFITICTHEKRAIFGKPGALNWIGQCAEENLHMISKLHPNIRLDKYVIMPNHIHAIFDVQGSKEKENLAAVIGQYKMSVTKRIRQKNRNFRYGSVHFMTM